MGEREAEQGSDHRARRGHDGRPALLQRDAHCLVPVLDELELLAVAGGQEQRVVRARAEDQDEEDAAGLPVDDHAGLGEERSEPSHDRLGEQDGEEGQHPEDRAPVDEDEQDEDEPGRHEEQGRVDPLEGLRRVGGEPGGPGHLRLDAGREPLVDRGAHALDCRDEEVCVASGRDGHADDGGGPVARPCGR